MAGGLQLVVFGFVLLALAQAACLHGGSVPKIKDVPPPQYPVQFAIVKNFSGLCVISNSK